MFAVSHITTDTLLFSDPVILVPEDQCPKGSVLHADVFLWSTVMEDGLSLNAIVLGLGTMLNHSKSPNVIVYFDQNPDRAARRATD
jgi:hypothetical protein